MQRRAALALVLLTACRDHPKPSPDTGDAADLPAPSAAVPVPKGMVLIPGGVLLAGTPEGRLPRIADAEMPGSQVVLHPFFIDELPYPNEAGSIPRTGVSQRESANLCAAQQKRLCSELEWERACKGPQNTTYPYGDSYKASECGTGTIGVAVPPTGVLTSCKSGFGVRDLHGGVWQWTSSPWGRGTTEPLFTLRGGNAEAGEVVGRCANGIGRRPTEARGEYGFRCCSGERNVAEVTLDIVKGDALRNVSNDKSWTAALEASPPAELSKKLAGRAPFQVLTTWRWRPIGNEELVLLSGCAQLPPHALCGIAVARLKGKSLEMLAFAATDWWVPTLKDDMDPRDLWVFGGNELGAYRRKLQYAWGQIIVGEAEHKVKPGSPKKRDL